MNHAIRIHQTGGPEVLTWEEVPDPKPAASQLLVQLHAAGLNFIDTYHRSGLYPVDLPTTPGMEGSGTIIAVGDNSAGFEPGDRVAWVGAPGSYAEKLLVPASSALRIPDSVSLDEAAAMPLQGMTAHYLACSTFPLAPGHRCLIHAAAGGTGRLLVQMAVNRGAEVVAAVGSESKVDLARSAGAHHVIDSGSGDLVQSVEAAVGPAAFDVVYDGVGAATFDAGLQLLKPRGTMVTFGNASGPVPPITPLTLMERSLFLTRPKLWDYMTGPGEAEGRWSDLTEWVGNGSLEINIGLRLPLADAAEAHRRLENRSTTGKVLLAA